MTAADREDRPGEAGRLRLAVRGRVQGVGFRPWVYRLAVECGLAGHAGNDNAGAFVEIEGAADARERFLNRLMSEAPPLVRIASVERLAIPPKGETGFRILPSDEAGRREAEITPDAATCDDCLRELFDPGDRRYRYPFTNCTNCGPRYSIIRAVPYDRPNTTMRVFPMCAECRREYDDPGDRRFHAQPNACPVCGPRVWMTDAAGNPLERDPVREAARWLKEGRIVAIKGIGGFHLACRADDGEAVLRLRRRKAREAKPLAVMVGSPDEARLQVRLGPAAERALLSAARPIVLAPRTPESTTAEEVAPGNAALGVMLPYTPLHALLFAEALPPLVMTSGNPSAEPLSSGNDEALDRLGGIADAFLLNDRDIERPVDDSVVLAADAPDRPEGMVVPIRRARGYAPSPIRIRPAAKRAVLALGAEMKSTICLLRGEEAVLSEHLGDLDNPAAFRNFLAAMGRLRDLLRVEPEIVAYDPHPEYAASRHARSLGIPLIAVQHHHAHVASLAAEHALEGPLLGIACDGTGYGDDGTIWGCEILIAEGARYERVGHLRPFPLPGGDAGARETWRPAAGLLRETAGETWRPLLEEAAGGRIDPEALRLVEARLRDGGDRIVRTSSLGRLFDAAAFLVGAADRNRFEAEAPMALEALAGEPRPVEPLPFLVARGEGGKWIIDPAPLIDALLDGARGGRSAAEAAAAFHETIAAALAEAALRVAEERRLDRIGLTGGCFANRFLLLRLRERLRETGRKVYIHQEVPPGDGGISLGQAWVAAAAV
ncbi:MAG: carbamoyltransferase HypF [Candidatus Eisenbacteria bacterium]|nr:carbamoyltransferase HypF [Candidatus Eisenbacteria bacterium]